MTAEPARWDTRNAISFWWLAALLVAFLAGASAPSPLYPIYQAQFGFTTLTITAIYAAYAIGGVGGLLVAGRVSDYVGRRPVVAIALVVQLVAMACFVAANGELLLYVGRILHGLGVGIGVSALSAWLVDLQPPADPRLGGLISSSAAMLGLGAGGFASGLLVEFGPDPTHLVYILLSALYLIGLIGLVFMPDVSVRRPGWLGSLTPDVGVPPTARTEFAIVAPSLMAMWALAGLLLSLGPTLAISLMDRPSPAAGGLMIFLLLGTGAVASVLVLNRDAGPLVATGSAILIAGVAVTLAGLFLGYAVVLFIGAFIAGVGLGPAFSAVVRRLTPLAPVDRRAALLAAIFVGVYVSFSVPAIVAGVFTSAVGLKTTAYGYGVIVGLLAAITTIAVTRRARAARKGAPESSSDAA